MAQQILPDDGDGHAGGGDVLLDAEVDAAVFRHVHRAGEDHRAHVRHQRDALHLGDFHILGAENGVVLADVDVAGVGVVGDGADVGDVGKVFVLAGGDHLRLAELGGLFGGQVGEVAGDDVVGLAGGHKVQGHHGELLGRAALEKADLVVVGDLHQPAQAGLGVLYDVLEPLAAVAHFHHALAAAVVVQHLGLGRLKHLLGQHAGPGAEIVYSSHGTFPLSLSLPRDGAAGPRRMNSIKVLAGQKQERFCTKREPAPGVCGHRTHKCALYAYNIAYSCMR